MRQLINLIRVGADFSGSDKNSNQQKISKLNINVLIIMEMLSSESTIVLTDMLHVFDNVC